MLILGAGIYLLDSERTLAAGSKGLAEHSQHSPLAEMRGSPKVLALKMPHTTDKRRGERGEGGGIRSIWTHFIVYCVFGLFPQPRKRIASVSPLSAQPRSIIIQSDTKYTTNFRQPVREKTSSGRGAKTVNMARFVK